MHQSVRSTHNVWELAALKNSKLLLCFGCSFMRWRLFGARKCRCLKMGSRLKYNPYCHCKQTICILWRWLHQSTIHTYILPALNCDYQSWDSAILTNVFCYYVSDSQLQYGNQELLQIFEMLPLSPGSIPDGVYTPNLDVFYMITDLNKKQPEFAENLLVATISLFFFFLTLFWCYRNVVVAYCNFSWDIWHI